jgi:ubiquinone/menaquinone biosynthesis C-methylase UbiE
MNEAVNVTGKLFGDLWHRYDDTLYEESVALFARRFEANGFDLSWFRGKKCLDAGCGGGRYTIAMARLGASQVIGCDISEKGLEDCRRRARDIPTVSFERASVAELPFDDASFDFVCCSGVLHHTEDPEKGLREIARVLRPGGRVFLLLYGARGLRWPTIMDVRPHARVLGYEAVDGAIKAANLPANKQRTFLDDLFVPMIAFYEWSDVRALLERNGFESIERWERGKLDHEASIDVQRSELEQLHSVFAKGIADSAPGFVAHPGAAIAARDAIASAIARLDDAVGEFGGGRLDRPGLEAIVFGAGHHRVLGQKKG